MIMIFNCIKSATFVLNIINVKEKRRGEKEKEPYYCCKKLSDLVLS